MVNPFGRPFLTTLSRSLHNFYYKQSLKFPCQFSHRNYCSNNENVFAYSAIFKDKKEAHVSEDKLKDFIPLFSPLMIPNGNQLKSKPRSFKLTDMQKWISQQSQAVDPSNIQPEITVKFIDGLCMSFKSLSDNELLTVIQFLNHDKNLDSSLCSTIFSKLDNECIRRLPQWTWNVSCQAMRVWYNLNMVKLCNFYKKAISHFSPQIQNLNAQQLLEFSFFLNLNRSFPTQLNHRNFETQLLLLWNDFSLDEIGVISMAFFKCQKEILNPALLDKLISAVKDNAAVIDDITLAAILKLIRRSCTDASKTPASVIKLFDALIDEVDRLNPKAIIQLVTVAGSLNYFHHPTLEKVAKLFTTKIGATRLKDLERFALSLSSSGYKSPSVDEFWKEVETELIKSERQIEIRNFPRSLISLLVYFVTLGKFPEELFKIAFHSENLNKALGIVLFFFSFFCYI